MTKPGGSSCRRNSTRGGIAAANSDSVATRGGADSMVAETLKEFGQLDIVINNAGIIRNRTFLNISGTNSNRLSTFTSKDVSLSAAPHMNT